MGRGLLGALMNTDETLRIPEIQQDYRSIGFPQNHPHMRSFLGVPIRYGETQLGQIYLTEKLEAPEFTRDDAGTAGRMRRRQDASPGGDRVPPPSTTQPGRES